MTNIGGLTTDLSQKTIEFDPAPEKAEREHTIMVAMCNKCRGWYSMDMEPSLDDDHFDMRTGEPCINEDDWFIAVVPDREDWYNVR
jgi:hypothetical protein